MPSVNENATKPTPGKLPERCTKAEFARLLGVDAALVSRWIAGKRIEIGDAGRVLVRPSLTKLLLTTDPARGGRGAVRGAGGGGTIDRARELLEIGNVPERPAEEDPPEGDDASDYGSHAQRRAKALADKEEELAAKARRERLIEEGALLRRDQVEPAVSLAFGHLRQALEGAARDMAPELAAMDDEDRIAATLTDRFERLLGNLSRSLAALAQRQGA